MSISHILRCATALIALLAAGTALAAGPFPSDSPGGVDHPLIKRFVGSSLIGYKVADWDQAILPLSLPHSGNDYQLADKVVVEGKVTRLAYLSPLGKTPLEVFRNYEQALQGAGLKKKYACDTDCANLYFSWSKADKVTEGLQWAKGQIHQANGAGAFNIYSPLDPFGRMLVGTLSKEGTETYVLLYTSNAANKTTGMAATYLVIVEPKSMPTGQVVVDASAMKSGLQSDGKISLYGLYFDTGKADIKPESNAQLSEMAKLLRSQPALNVYIVGHTDNVGSVDNNLALSLQRAQAVVTALGSTYKVDTKRLQARGVASLAPVATNASEEGRAKNRRVELVVQ
ncbi:MAG: hypothetical protein EPO06_10950 [Burkholderiaceae bacterium]|nr:MAG: hypothetical protein EPO06_10950 [Burkholderiaceae bacterium]